MTVPEAWLCMGNQRVAKLEAMTVDATCEKGPYVIGVDPGRDHDAEVVTIVVDSLCRLVAEIAKVLQENPRAAMFLGEDGQWSGVSSPSSSAVLRWDPEMLWWAWWAWSPSHSRHVDGWSKDLMDAMTAARTVARH